MNKFYIDMEVCNITHVSIFPSAVIIITINFHIIMKDHIVISLFTCSYFLDELLIYFIEINYGNDIISHNSVIIYLNLFDFI